MRTRNPTVPFYESFLKPILFSLDPELVHEVAIATLARLSRIPWLLDVLSRSGDNRFNREVFGLRFPNPLGLAAGFDKNGMALPAWEALGFGFVEIGTITAQGQVGNPRPRVFRIKEMEALINRLGFNNEGAEKIAVRLGQLRGRPQWPKIPVGVNIGKSKVVPLEEAASDYLRSFQRLEGIGDYFVLNVSSPNTPGLRKLQEGAAIRELFAAIQQQNQGKPLLVKIAPDLVSGQLDHILALADEFRLAGVVATNTTVNQEVIPQDKRRPGGLSGEPLRTLSLGILHHIKKHSSLPVISVGGIMNADDAKQRFDAGAELVQIYTGFVFRGPRLVWEITESLRKKGE
ncbi:MAG: quinone-dependent dihydroorotate dehydrogenase [Verrucomicrobia bacterium]|nr:quinone-dependent dihydroorotate dehydrogenase [Verrucomicrobiota bacterium]MBV9644916.1 quinone-dependent dihydroorotate dehydrogenase [Verrucomicrobiota bacterium]